MAIPAVLQLTLVNTLVEILASPVGPAIVLLVGAVVELIIGRWVRRPGILTGLALFFVAIATWLFLGLRTEPVVPVFSQPWQPPLHSGTNLLWVGDGWNWYISGLILLLGGVGILLELNNVGSAQGQGRRRHPALTIHLGVLAAGLLFVGSGNVLTAMLTWVVLDLFILVRGALQPEGGNGERPGMASAQQARGLSLLGALLLLIGLLPAGPLGPGQPLQGGNLPPETLLLMLLASLIRAGIYPFHLWLLSPERPQLDVAERLLDHMIPVLCGLWLLGWTMDLGTEFSLFQADIVALLLLSLLGSALAAWTAQQQPDHTTLVLVTSAGLAALAGALAYNRGPEGLIWPTTAFALGGALWLVGDQVWQAWGWQIPVSVGALALVGVPFTPGFLTQPAVARLLILGDFFYLFLFGLFVIAQSMQIAALLQSWSTTQKAELPALQTGVLVRLLVAAVLLGLALAITGFFPETIAGLASMPEAIPPTLGNPPNVVAEVPVWIALGLPLLLGIGLVMVQPALWRVLGPWPERLSVLSRLEWLFQMGWWGINRASVAWGTVLNVVEGAGYVGWVLVFLLMGYLLVR